MVGLPPRLEALVAGGADLHLEGLQLALQHRRQRHLLGDLQPLGLQHHLHQAGQVALGDADVVSRLVVHVQPADDGDAHRPQPLGAHDVHHGAAHAGGVHVERGRIAACGQLLQHLAHRVHHVRVGRAQREAVQEREAVPHQRPALRLVRHRLERRALEPDVLGLHLLVHHQRGEVPALP